MKLKKNISKRHVVILKNDAVGDLVHSLKAINNLINDNEIKKITIFLSNLSKNFSFLIKSRKVDVKILNYNLKVFEKLKLFFYFLKNEIDEVYILSPKNFYYYLPLIFFRTKFNAICVNNINNYKRPSSFLRSFLNYYEINDRSAIFKRKPTSEIQNNLIQKKNILENREINFPLPSKKLEKHLPKNYFYFHLNKKRLNALGWGINDLKILFNELLKNCDYLVITKDIEIDENTKILKDNFTTIDLKNENYFDKKTKILFIENIQGIDLYNLIRFSKKIICFHGMMTNLASIEKKKVLDLWYCRNRNWEDYRNSRNSFYEFKPKYKGYDFIIPSKSIEKTIRKMKFSFKNEK